jgi:hypothetical protein
MVVNDGICSLPISEDRMAVTRRVPRLSLAELTRVPSAKAQDDLSPTRLRLLSVTESFALPPDLGSSNNGGLSRLHRRYRLAFRFR